MSWHNDFYVECVKRLGRTYYSLTVRCEIVDEFMEDKELLEKYRTRSCYLDFED